MGRVLCRTVYSLKAPITLSTLRVFSTTRQIFRNVLDILHIIECWILDGLTRSLYSQDLYLNLLFSVSLHLTLSAAYNPPARSSSCCCDASSLLLLLCPRLRKGTQSMLMVFHKASAFPEWKCSPQTRSDSSRSPKDRAD